jgi:hypothetical protein
MKMTVQLAITSTHRNQTAPTAGTEEPHIGQMETKLPELPESDEIKRTLHVGPFSAMKIDKIL